MKPTSSMRFDHVAVTVSNLERSIPFYCDLLGLKKASEHFLEGEVISRMTGKVGVQMKVVRLVCSESPGIHIDLQQYVHPKGKMADSKLGDVANGHFCIAVTDIGATCKKLTDHGVKFFSEPVNFDLGDEGKIAAVFFLDPDGCILELTEYIK